MGNTNVKKGQKVFWTDPDDGISSGMYKILKDTIAEGDTPILIGNGSSEAEVLISELEFEQKVIFRKFKDGDIIALFPEEVTKNGYTVMSYMHMGQHSTTDYDSVVSGTKLAKESECSDLINELVGRGYTNLRVMKKCRPKF